MMDLPGPLVKEWGNWCMEKELIFSPKYSKDLISKNTYKDFNFPIHVIVADDDEICTARNMKNFWKHVESPKGIQFEVYKANEFSRKKLGHFGYYKKGSERIWRDIVSVLEGWVG